MELIQAINFLDPAIPKQKEVWADIGAGTGTFTLALDQLLAKGSTIYSLDKDPSALYSLELKRCTLQVKAQDFDEPFDLPMMDGIIMANTLHYSPHPISTLNNLLKILRPKGQFILIEYELDHARPPWIPYPITFQQFCSIAAEVSFSLPIELGRLPSAYGNNYMYLASCEKEGEKENAP